MNIHDVYTVASEFYRGVVGGSGLRYDKPPALRGAGAHGLLLFRILSPTLWLWGEASRNRSD